MKEVTFDDCLINNLQDLIQFREALVICDKNTVAFLPVSLKKEKNIKVVTLLKDVRPHESVVKALMTHTRDRELVIALGSGTITDICKYLAHLTQKELVLFPTAPSVNAYTSPTASIIPIGRIQKSSLSTKMPSYVYLDNTILKKAPPRMIASGFYDLICSGTVKVDYLIASVVLKYKYIGEIFEELLPYEEVLLKHRKLLVKGDSTLVNILMQALNISGFGMCLNGNSRSASQSEHVIAHLLEKKYGEHFLHGEMVAVGTLLTSSLQEELFKNEQPLKIDAKTITRYKQLKGIHLPKIGNLRETFTELRALSPLLASMVSKHLGLRRCITSISANLPKTGSSFSKAFLLKRNFTCLDVAYLTNHRTNII